jgi:hypothetical protein
LRYAALMAVTLSNPCGRDAITTQNEKSEVGAAQRSVPQPCLSDQSREKKKKLE